MKSNSDTILEGIRPTDFQYMNAISDGQPGEVSPDVVDRLVSNGWIQPAYGTYLITLTGRTLLDLQRARRV